MTVQLTSVYGINQLFIWMKMFLACYNKRQVAQLCCISQIYLLSYCMSLQGFCICRCHLFIIHWRFYCAVKKKLYFISMFIARTRCRLTHYNGYIVEILFSIKEATIATPILTFHSGVFKDVYHLFWNHLPSWPKTSKQKL